MATAGKATVVGNARAGFDLQMSLPWQSSRPISKVTKDIMVTFVAAFDPDENISVWTGVMEVQPGGGHKLWWLATAVEADREINSLNIKCNCNRVYMLWIRNTGNDEVVLESRAGGLGSWPPFMTEGSYLHIPSGTTLFAFSKTGWEAAESMCLRFMNNHAVELGQIECGIIGRLL